MTFKMLVVTAALTLTAATAAQAQINAPNTGFGPPNVEGVESRSVYRPQRTEPQAFPNESDERGGRNYGNPENPELGQ